MNVVSALAVLCLLGALHAGCLTSAESIKSESSETAAASEATRVVQSLIRIPTVTPPGNELAAAKYLAAFLSNEGIEATLVESSPGRGNVMARLRGDDSKRAILLLCHLDVVPVEQGWSVDPFAGMIAHGSVYGRGAIDDKGMCAINLIAFAELKRQGVALARDVIFLATADEEGKSEGVRYMLERYPEQLDVEYVLNEGAGGIEGLLKPGQVVFGVAAGDKGFARIRVTARSQPGHGGMPSALQAPHVLIPALAHLLEQKQPLVSNRYVEPMFKNLAEHESGWRGFLMRHPRLFASLLLRATATTPTGRAVVSNTISIVELKANGAVATVPAVAEAWLDARLLPGVTPEAFVVEIEAHLRDFDVEIELEHGWAATLSPWDTELSRALERQLPDGLADSVVGPVLSPAWTDSRFFRDRGAVAYGVPVFVLSEQQLAGIHSHDEHIPIAELGAGVRRMFRILVDLAASASVSSTRSFESLPQGM